MNSKVSKFLPAFGAKGWMMAGFGIAFYYFYQCPLQLAINFLYGYLEEMYGWSNATLSLAVTIGNIIGVLSIFIWGPLTKKWGAKKVSIVGLVGSALAVLIFALFPTIATWYIAIIISTFFTMGFIQMGVATFAANWFPRTRGMYMGMATMGLTAGSATFTLITSNLVPAWGLAPTYIMWSAIMIVVAILVAIFAKNTPEEAGAWPDNDKSVTREELDREFKAMEEYKKNSPWTVKAILKCKYTWTMAIGWGMCMMAASGFISQLVPTLISFGHDPNLGIILLSTMWPAGVIGNWLGGVADNFFGTRTASMIFAAIDLLSTILVVTMGNNVVVVTIATALFMASMSAFSNVSVSMATNLFGRADFPNAWPVISVPFKIIESFGITIIAVAAAVASFKVSYIVIAICLVVSLILMRLTTDKQIGSQIDAAK